MSGNRITLSWLAFVLATGFYLLFGFGKLYEPGPPYDDPLGGPDALFEVAQIAAIPMGLCLLLGFAGFYQAYAHRLGLTGQAGWGLMSLGALGITLGGLVYIPTRNDTFWEILLLGNFILAFGLILTGIASYQRQLFSRYRWAPLLIGLPYAVIFLAGNLNPAYEAKLLMGILIFLLTGTGWLLFAAALRSGTHEGVSPA